MGIRAPAHPARIGRVRTSDPGLAAAKRPLFDSLNRTFGQPKMIESVPYWCRVALLVFLMSLVAAIDWLRNRQNATKWKEYGFVLISGVAGALVGLLNDLITSSVSPDYFVFGKGLEPGKGLALRAAILGMKAGFSAGAIAGAICLYAGTRDCRRPPLPGGRLLRFLWRPVALAPTMAFILAFFFRWLDPFGLSIQLEGVLDSQQMERLLTVWRIHAGLYLGLLAGVVWIIVDIVRLRKGQATPSAG